ncbi:MAG: hypothetical protein SOT07_02660 [Paludibacteraceae bacterium]|nr:hypothetical protein [Paludibacteraceae bacterium]
MKKLKFAALLLPVILLSACESVEMPIVNVESATMTVGDSLYVSVRNVPNN